MGEEGVGIVTVPVETRSIAEVVRGRGADENHEENMPPPPLALALLLTVDAVLIDMRLCSADGLPPPSTLLLILLRRIVVDAKALECLSSDETAVAVIV